METYSEDVACWKPIMLYDFPVSYTFRRYEAWLEDGIELPALVPSYNDELPIINEQYVGEHPERWDSKQVALPVIKVRIIKGEQPSITKERTWD